MNTEPLERVTSFAPSVYSASVDQVDEGEWNRLLPVFDEANLYQTWAYGAVSWGERQLSHLVLRRQGVIVAAAQIRLAQVPILRKGVAYLRWGPLWRTRGQVPDVQVLRQVVRAVISEYVRRRRLLLRIVPNVFQEDALAETAVEVWRSEGFKPIGSVPAYRTIRVDLSAPLEVIRKRLDQKWRNQLNSAERNGLTVREGTSDDLFERFLRIYDEMIERKQFDTSTNPRDFALMQRRLPADQKMVVMLAEKDGQLVSGLVGAALGEMGVYLHGATSNAGTKSKGSYLLQWLMIQRLRELGCQMYDLGGISPARNPGVYHFKQGFGGQEVQQLNRVELQGSFLSGLFVGLAERAQQMARALSGRSWHHKAVAASH